MHIVFSIDDQTDSFWPATAPVPSPESQPSPAQTTAEGMTRSQSEWAFQRLLKEISGPDQTNNTIDRLSPPVQSNQYLPTAEAVEIHQKQPPPPQSHQGNRDREVDPDQYHAILKSQLDLACAAAVARRRVGTMNPENSIEQSQGFLVAQASTSIQKKLDVPARQATSISSRDDSDYDDADNGDPTDVKRARRMVSNRESARRSRRRKQEQMSDFDTQVGKLRGEHSTLVSRYSDMNHKCDTAAVDNRILRADIETLRAKVKMAEETVKRVTGVNPLHWARPNMGTPLNNTPSDSSRILPNSNRILKPATPSTTAGAGLAPNQRVERGNLMSQQVNREGMQNQFATNPNLYETLPNWNHKI